MNVVTLMKLAADAYVAYDRKQRKQRLATMTPKLPDADRFDDLKSAKPNHPPTE